MRPEIVGIGACVMDTLVTVPSYPAEDTKLRALETRIAGGGPAATGLVAAAKLGASAGFIGVLSADSAGEFLKKDFERFGVSTDTITVREGFRAFTSTIWLSRASASRTCVFDKGSLPPLRLNDAQKDAIRGAKLLMIDGNELDAAEEACAIARGSGASVLYDCGGLYPNVERLLAKTDYMIPSEEFALGHTGCENAEDAARRLMELYHPRVVVITQGKRGGILYDGTAITPYPAFPVEAVDTNGSGDVFHGAFAAGLCRGFAPKKCCVFASAVSAIKCTGIGARDSAPEYDTVKQFVKEHGYEL